MSDQPSLTDEFSTPCPHGVDLNYFVCPECGNTPTQTISVAARLTYKIVRFYQDPARRKRVMATGLTLEQAQFHCNRPDTQGDGWFDGYEVEQ